MNNFHYAQRKLSKNTYFVESIELPSVIKKLHVYFQTKQTFPCWFQFEI